MIEDGRGALIVGVACLFCIARGVVDCRQRRYRWGVAGLIVGVALLLVPIKTHAVKIDLPMAAR